MIPADKRLSAAEDRHIGTDIELGLEEDDELFPGEGVMEIVQQAFSEDFLLMQCIVIERDRRGKAAPDGIRCVFRAIEAPLQPCSSPFGFKVRGRFALTFA